jgi:hypothetical protein
MEELMGGGHGGWWDEHSKLQVKYATEELATVVMTALGVDEEVANFIIRILHSLFLLQFCL